MREVGVRTNCNLRRMTSQPATPWAAHTVGRLQESPKNPGGARSEYQAALKLNGKYKLARKAEAARKRLSEVFRNVNAHTRSSRGVRETCSPIKCARC